MSKPYPASIDTWRKLCLTAALSTSVLGTPGVVLAANETAVKALIEQAEFWQARGRSDRAADAWRKLLRLDPENTAALAGLARFELDNNRPDLAKTYTERLKQSQSGAAVARRIEGQAAERALSPKALEEARGAARSGKGDDAIRTYRQLLGGKTPTGPLALEYYQTLGGTERSCWLVALGHARIDAGSRPSGGNDAQYPDLARRRIFGRRRTARPPPGGGASVAPSAGRTCRRGRVGRFG